MIARIVKSLKKGQKVVLNREDGLWRCAVEGPGPELIEVFNLKFEKALCGLDESFTTRGEQ